MDRVQGLCWSADMAGASWWCSKARVGTGLGFCFPFFGGGVLSVKLDVGIK